jgi:hypothetical protein
MYDCDTVYEMLVSLQKRLKPKKDVRRRELINKFIKLRDHPESHRIDEWLQEYEKTEKVWKRRFRTSTESMWYKALQTTSNLSPEFATFYEMTLIRNPDIDRQATSLS